MKIVASLARAAGAPRLASELGIAVIPLEGFTNWEHVAPFKWLVDEFLAHAVKVFVWLDRDYRPQFAVNDVLDRLSGLGIQGHVWERKELESYLLVASCLSRGSKAPAELIETELDRVADSMKAAVFARALDEEQRYTVSDRKHDVTVIESLHEKFDKAWGDVAFRLSSCPAKDVLHAINRFLTENGFETVSARNAARLMKTVELTDEMRELFLEVEAAI